MKDEQKTWDTFKTANFAGNAKQKERKKIDSERTSLLEINEEQREKDWQNIEENPLIEGAGGGGCNTQAQKGLMDRGLWVDMEEVQIFKDFSVTSRCFTCWAKKHILGVSG